ncbi:MAG: hypothetical protein H7A07_02575 [Pseudomonadales bacterium]|nr:hypothetical protein [Pseudomonadales bacterium]
MADDVSIRLKKLKELARSELDDRSSLAQIRLHEHLFEVSGNGRHPFAFVLADGWYRIELAKKDAKLTPMAHCRIASEILTTLGPDDAVHDLSKVISAIGILSEPPSVSRADLCVDFVSDYPLDAILNDQWVTKARRFDSHIDERRFSGFSIAAGSPLSARLYNKTLEMKKNPRPYLLNLWRNSGWDGVSDVWRLEFQLRRQALRDLSVVRYFDLMDSLAGIWRYCTHEWLRHTLPNEADGNQSRWPLSSFWLLMQSAPWTGLNEVVRVDSERSRGPSDRHLFINGLSALTSFMARDGYLDAGEAAAAYVDAAKEYHDSQAFDKDGKKGTGIDFENYVLTKIREKRKVFNTGKNTPLDGGIHPADKAVADEYRKRSDGDY